MAVNSIVEILKIRSEQDFHEIAAEFETTVHDSLKPLSDKLRQQLLSQEVPQLELHMTFVESWRDRVSRSLMLATAFEQHGKSHYFLLPSGKNVTATDREAYQRSITSLASSICVYLEQLLKSIDSRVNLCKKLLGNEGEGAVNNRRFNG
jgi:hypothetical protein